jgi:hypothetical protein
MAQEKVPQIKRSGEIVEQDHFSNQEIGSNEEHMGSGSEKSIKVKKQFHNYKFTVAPNEQDQPVVKKVNQIGMEDEVKVPEKPVFSLGLLNQEFEMSQLKKQAQTARKASLAAPKSPLGNNFMKDDQNEDGSSSADVGPIEPAQSSSGQGNEGTKHFNIQGSIKEEDESS